MPVLFQKHGQKVVKIPVNLPLTCQNRDATSGSIGQEIIRAYSAMIETRMDPGHV